METKGPLCGERGSGAAPSAGRRGARPETRGQTAAHDADPGPTQRTDARASPLTLLSPSCRSECDRWVERPLGGQAPGGKRPPTCWARRSAASMASTRCATASLTRRKRSLSSATVRSSPSLALQGTSSRSAALTSFSESSRALWLLASFCSSWEHKPRDTGLGDTPQLDALPPPSALGATALHRHHAAWAPWPQSRSIHHRYFTQGKPFPTKLRTTPLSTWHDLSFET